MKQKTEVLKATLILGLVGSLAFLNTKEIMKTTPAEQYEKLEKSMTVYDSIFTTIDKEVAKREQFTQEYIEEMQQKIEAERIKAEQERLRQEQEQKRLEHERLINTVGTVGYSMGFTAADVDLLNRLVEAEAGAEPYNGKIAVANVVINRIKSEKYPNTIQGVIYQANQFEVVAVGTIDAKIPSEETKQAVKQALNGVKAVGDDIVFFWANYLNKSNPIWQHCTIQTTIGGHHFSNSWE